MIATGRPVAVAESVISGHLQAALFLAEDAFFSICRDGQVLMTKWMAITDSEKIEGMLTST